LGFGGFPFGGFPFSGEGDDDFFGVDSDERRTSPESDAADDDDEEETSKIPCGFLCSILKGLEDHFKEVAGRRNETAKDDYDVYNETYTEKVMRGNGPPVFAASRWQHGSQICFATFI
jgi:hypothetical protein